MRRRGTTLIVVAALASATLATVAGPVRADVVCTFDAGTHSLHVSNSSGFLHIRASTRGDLLVTGVDCGKISQIDHVTVDTTGAFDLRFDLRNPLGPGYTDEGDGSSELEFSVVNASGYWPQVEIDGSNGPDGITVGSGSDADTSINLNALADGATPDVDVTVVGHPFLVLNGRGGNDLLSAAGIGGGGPGPFAGSVTLIGGDGSDTMQGGDGPDTIRMQDSSPDGPDFVSGGGGTDAVRLSLKNGTQPAGVFTITLDGVANDGLGCPGTTCEGDNFAHDIEAIYGSVEKERMFGGPRPQSLIGGGGADLLAGGGGNDILVGAWGNDKLLGNGGRDRLNGDRGQDLLSGGAGDDSLDGGPGTDTCRQGSGVGFVGNCEL